MIPNKIHYIWIGKDMELLASNTRRKCYQSVYKYCKSNNAEFKLWTDKDFKGIIDNTPYLKFLYDNKYYAIIADYFKYYILHKEGGMYLDTDIEISEAFPKILLDTNDYLFSSSKTGYTNDELVLNASFIFSKPELPLLRKVLDYYHTKIFKIAHPTDKNVYMDCAITSEVFKDYHLQNTGFYPNLFLENRLDIENTIYCIDQAHTSHNNNNFILKNHYEMSWNINKPIMWRITNE
jgi:mannosyltransferase OCH1-like enzyme